MIILRKLNINDLEEYKYWKLPKHKYHSLNGPYFKQNSLEDIEKLIARLKNDLKENILVLENKRIISNENNEILGEVNWYWKSQETHWMEIGIVIFDQDNWFKGIGSKALELWINKLFNEKAELIRLGLSTWSGNEGMIKLSKKLGMTKEAEYRKARIVDEEYYDSVSYGILKEEWQNNSKNN